MSITGCEVRLMIVTITLGVYTFTDYLGCLLGTIAEGVSETIKLRSVQIIRRYVDR
jgi:hypothetical protein